MPAISADYTALRYHDNGLYLGTREHGLHFSDDMGETWQTVDALPTDATIRRITTNDTIIAVGCEDGSVYLKYEHSVEWQQMDNLPVEGPILDICIEGERLYASPMAGGIWYTELPPMPDFIAESNEVTFTVAPNPASAFITVSSSEPLHHAELTLYNLQGKVCYSSIMQSNQHEIPVHGISAGIYLVKVVSDNAITVRKITIQH